jgi:hypothetical protein
MGGGNGQLDVNIELRQPKGVHRTGSGRCSLRRGARGVDRVRWSVADRYFTGVSSPDYSLPATAYALLEDTAGLKGSA